MSELTTLTLKLPRNTEVTPESAKTFLSALTKINPMSPWDKLFRKQQKAFALEIVLQNQQISYRITCDSDLKPFVETQLKSNYPLVILEKGKDPLETLNPDAKNFEIKRLYLSKGNYYPINTFDKFSDVDPTNSILSVLAKGDPEEITVIQIALETSDGSWQGAGATYASKGTKKEDGSYSPRPDASVINEKISYPGYRVAMRLISNTNKTLSELSNAYGVYMRSDGNSFTAKTPGTFQYKKELLNAKKRIVADFENLNILELATIWHLPSEKIKVPGLLWGVAVLSEPPFNLPASQGMTDDEKQKINFFGRTLYKNQESIFGIKDGDRLRHIWTVGKTGTGKSTMIANMAIDDFKKGRGVAIIDPHGDLCEDLLNYIPKSRINDTVYFNPADRDYSIVINPLEVTNHEEAELIVSGLMSIFTKVWQNVWSARMEYILRNSFMTLAELPNSTLEDVLKMLVSQSYRNRVLSKITDRTLINFWKDEYEQMPPALQKEAVAPIQNKVGQFVTSPMIRRIIGMPKSTISLDDVMNEKKIFLANLSQGKLGEDNSALLGATLINKFQLSAMRRADRPKEERVPFYLYVDEFQNFATDSFIKILSEARKYGLALTLANQYMGQLPEEITKAILGNAGSIISFAVGASDAAIIHKEYAEVFSDADLVNLQNFQIALKLMIDGHTSRPFLATTLPLPASINQNKEKVIKVSNERYARRTKELDTQNAEQPDATDFVEDKKLTPPAAHAPLTEVKSPEPLLPLQNRGPAPHREERKPFREGSRPPHHGQRPERWSYQNQRKEGSTVPKPNNPPQPPAQKTEETPTLPLKGDVFKS
jgi:hypothetical protein